MTETEPGTDALVGTTVAERYRVEEVLGHGGMGTVYRAEHVGMKKTVALKVLHPEIALIGDSAARFEREAVAAARIEHPNVARAMDFGRLEDGSFYLVIEHVDGESLAELLKRGPLSPPRALELARQIAEAVAAAHRVGVVHRDLKPANVMLTDGGSVKVLDFGVAKLVSQAASDGSAITRLGELVGTPEYMAPEQAGGGEVDQRADLYALGVMLYELLSGRPPFCGDDRVAIVAKHFVEPPPPLPASIPESTRALVLALLEKEPDARIQTATELISQLDQARAELEVPAAEPSRPSNRRAVLLAAAALAVALAIGVGVTRREIRSASRTAALSVQAGMQARVPAPSAPPATSAEAAEQDPPTETSAVAARATARAPASRPVPTVTTTALPKGTRVIIRRRVIRRTITTR